MQLVPKQWNWGTKSKGALSFCSTIRINTQTPECQLQQIFRIHHLPGGRLRHCAFVWRNCQGHGHSPWLWRTFWLKDLSRSHLCEFSSEEPLQAGMSAEQSRPSLRLSLELRGKLTAPEPSLPPTFPPGPSHVPWHQSRGQASMMSGSPTSGDAGWQVSPLHLLHDKDKGMSSGPLGIEKCPGLVLKTTAELSRWLFRGQRIHS